MTTNRASLHPGCWQKTLKRSKIPGCNSSDYDKLMVRDNSADYAYADKVAAVLEEERGQGSPQ